MQISVESTSELGRLMRVVIPEDQIRDKVNARFKELVRTAHLPGFRPGKVPLKILRQRFAKDVRSEIVGDTVKSSLTEALEQHDLNPAGTPQIDLVDDNVDQEHFSYTVTFEVFPEIDLSGLSSLTVKRPIATVEDTDVDRTIQTLRQQRQTWQPASRASQSGDRLSLTVADNGPLPPLTDGVIAGIKIASGKTQIELGSDQHRELEQALCGVNVGESHTITLPSITPPSAAEDASDQDSPPQSLVLTVDQIEAPVLPEIDGDFIATFDVADRSMDSFRVEIRKYMEKELADLIDKATKKRVFDALLDGVRFELPAAVVQDEIDHIRKQFDRQSDPLGKSGDSESGDDDTLSDYIEHEAQRSAALKLIIATVLKIDQIQVDDEQVHKKIELLAASYGDPDTVIRHIYADKRQLEMIQDSVLQQQVIERVLEQVNVEEESSSFDALMYPHREAKTTPSDDPQPMPETEPEGATATTVEPEQPPPQY